MEIKIEVLKTITSKISVPVDTSNNLDSKYTNKLFLCNNYIMGTDGPNAYCFPFKLDIVGAIPAKAFFDIVSKLSVEDVLIEKKKDKVVFKSGSTRAALVLSEIPEEINLLRMFELMKVKPEQWEKLPEDFMKGLDLCVFSLGDSIDSENNRLDCLKIEGKNILTSDQYRISKYSMKEKLGGGFPNEVLLPAKTCKQIVHIKDFTRQFYFDELNYFGLSNDDGSFYLSSTVEGELKIKQSTFLIKEGKSIEFPDKIKTLVSRASILADGDFDLDKQITVFVNKTKIICRGENQNGWIESFTDIENDVEPFKFAINPAFFLEVLNKTSKVKIGNDKALFSFGKFKNIISLFSTE